jgi:hypothetical protein
MFEQPRSMPKDREWNHKLLPAVVGHRCIRVRVRVQQQAYQATTTTSLEPPPQDSPESFLVVAASGKTETASLQELPDCLGLYRPLIEGAADYTDDHHPSAMVASTSLTPNKSEGKMLAALAKIWDESHQFVDISCIP